MKYTGAVFFDYDGTLSDEKKGIYYPTKTTQKALQQLSNNGYMVVLATGRAKCYVPETNISFDGYITSNGACAEVDGQIIWQDFFMPADAMELITELEKKGLCYSLENHSQCYSNHMNNTDFTAMLDNFNIAKEIFIPFDKSSLPEISKMIMVYNTEEEFNYLSDCFKSKFVFDKHRKFLSADISKKGIVKAVGAKAICDHFNIPIENTYAFGDGTNDYDILKFVGHGIAMGQHSSKLEEVAELITDTVENEGIFKALVKYGLIGRFA